MVHPADTAETNFTAKYCKETKKRSLAILWAATVPHSTYGSEVCVAPDPLRRMFNNSWWYFHISSTNTDSTKSNYSDDSEVDETESTSYMESDSKNFTLCPMNSSNAETTNRSFHDSNQVILSHDQQQQQHYITSDQSDSVNKSIVVSKADTISHSHENQCHMLHKGDTNFVSLNYFLMDVQLQMNKLNELAQIELKIDIQKMILEKLRKTENLKNDWVVR